MIINVDSNLEAYKHLLQSSYELLSDRDLLPEEYAGQDRFNSIEEMFANMATIVQAQPNYLIKLPIEEPTLKIDANKRSIDTTLLNHITSVQSDTMAEILVFSVNRYFDYVDLGHPDMKIVVQWTAPDGKNGTINGATPIELRDVETEPGKLRFGWPLNDVITAHPGKLQFAVRFFLQEDVEDFDGAGKPVTIKNKVVYSLNTRPADLTILKALQPELNDDTEIHNPQGLFSYIVANSVYSGKDIPIPQTPSFEAPGLQLPIEATLDENDTLTLMAQAVTGDTSSISYSWHYKAVGAESFSELTEGLGVAYRRAVGTKKALSDDYFSSEQVTVTDAQDIYYYAPEENPLGFVEYTGVVSTKEMPNGDIIMVDSDEHPLYEKYTTYTVPPTGEVTGRYQVRAIATTTVGNKAVNGGERYSRECQLISPCDINVTSDLAGYAVIEDVTNGAPLAVGIDETFKGNTTITYYWRKYDSKEDLTYEEDNTSTGNYGAKEAGWYKVYITAALNRQTNDYTSDWCKVTNLPAAPTLSAGEETLSIENSSYDKDDASLYIIPSSASESVTLAVKSDLVAGGVDDLECEALSYSWTISTTDGATAPLTVDHLAEGTDIQAATIKVPGVDSVTDAKIYSCTVTNTLNTKTASSTFAFQVM